MEIPNSGLTLTLASFLNTYVCILSGHMELYMSSFKCSLMWSSSFWSKEYVFLAPDFSACPKDLQLLRACCTSKDQGEEYIRYFVFLLFFVTRSLVPSICWPMFSVIFSLLIYLQEPFLLSATFFDNFYWWALDFLTPSLYYHSGSSAYILYTSFPHLSLVKSSLFIHAGFFPPIFDFWIVGIDHSWAWRRLF